MLISVRLKVGSDHFSNDRQHLATWVFQGLILYAVCLAFSLTSVPHAALIDLLKRPVLNLDEELEHEERAGLNDWQY